MSDPNEDDDIEVIELETEDIPVDEPEPEAPEPEAEDPDDSEDERLAQSEDEVEDHDDKAVNKNRRRRELQKAARDRAQRDLQYLREQNQALIDRVAAIEGSVHKQTEDQLDQRLSAAQREVETANAIISRAVEAGNGEDVVQAMRLKEDAQQRLAQVAAAKQAVSNRVTGPDPRIASLAREWADANPWFDPNGRSEESAIALAIDRVLPSEGYDPRSVQYYEELTRRLSRRLGTDSTQQATTETPAKRKAPPQGTTNQYVPKSTKQQVYVTPERKQAMMDAGYWDDPSLRNQMLKTYAAYDKSSAS